jgi:hypothetical protein
MTEAHNRQNGELTNRLRDTEAQFRLAREELELERRGRTKESGNTEKLLAESRATEEGLRKEIEDLRASKSHKVSELTKSFDAERTTLKVKNSELDKRVKEMEHARGQLFLEHEKERAKWNLERDHLIS